MGRLAVCGMAAAGMIMAGCAAGQGTENFNPSDQVQTAPTIATDQLQLQEALELELQRRGLDPERISSSPPQGSGNAVFDLTAQPYDPDGVEGPEPMRIQLRWTERLLGDYDQNGEVLASDLATLAQNFGRRVYYDRTVTGTESLNVPAGEETSMNWRMARIDGDASGEIGLSDLTVIAQHFGESIDGYRIYRLAPDSPAYFMLAHPQDPSLPYTIGRYESGGGGKQTVRYSFDDIITTAGTYRYFVVPYDVESGQEGRASLALVENR
ncbi:hypothetical protein KDL44_11450 [bacterium]|nr:hypothetical protein [bacterium]